MNMTVVKNLVKSVFIGGIMAVLAVTIFPMVDCLGGQTCVTQASPPPEGIDPYKPDQFISQVLQQAVSLLNSKKPTAEKEKVFRQLLKSCFDIRGIGIFALGPQWRGLDQATKDEYLKVFEAMVFRVYVDQIDQMTLNGFHVNAIKDIEEQGKKVVTTVIRADNPDPVEVEWTIFPKDSRYYILEVAISTVPVSTMIAREISDSINRNGGTVVGMLGELRERYKKDIEH